MQWSLVLYVVDKHDLAYTTTQRFSTEAECQMAGNQQAVEWNRHHLKADWIYSVCRPVS